MRAVCTISTYSHVSKAVTLLLSASDHAKNIELFVLLLDKTESIPSLRIAYPEIRFLVLSDLPTDKIIFLESKYALLSDSFRWSLKPILLAKLLSDFSVIQAFYFDNDLFFVNDFEFLFAKLNAHNILLFPHWRIHHPAKDKDWFETNFKDGVFNGGAIGVNNKSLAFLTWWGDCCAYKCEVDFSSGMYVDQKYLDLVPSIFPQSQIVQHKGCNVAYWNIRSLNRSLKNGQLVIGGADEIIFFHFTADYIRVLNEQEDPLVKPFLEKYLHAINLVESNMKTILS